MDKRNLAVLRCTCNVACDELTWKINYNEIQQGFFNLK